MDTVHVKFDELNYEYQNINKNEEFFTLTLIHGEMAKCNKSPVRYEIDCCLKRACQYTNYFI